MFSYIFSLLANKFVKIKRDRIVFTSFDGHYSDSPKYISDTLHSLSPETEIVWLVNEKTMDKVPKYAIAVYINSKTASKYSKNAVAFVDNVYWREVYTRTSDSFLSKLFEKLFALLAKHSRQYYFTTWHGTPLKRMARDQIGNNVYGFACPKNSYMINGNKFTQDIMDRLSFEKIKMVLSGTPRNDILFSGESERQAIKAKLGLPFDKKVITFAPTFRNDGPGIADKNIRKSGLDQLDMIDFVKLFEVLKNKFGDEFVFVGRFHYHVENAIDFSAFEEKYQKRIINGNLHDDMAEYLAVTDVLITDASSSMFDFALTGRPCFLLFPDVENYSSKERGFYLDVNRLPFPLSLDFEGLLNSILNFDNEKYKKNIEDMLLEFGYVDDAHSSLRAAEFILKTIEKAKK